MAGRKAERDQQASAAFYVLQGSTIVQNNQCICSLGKTAAQLKLEFDLFLRVVPGKNSPVAIHKPVVGFVVDEGWEYQNHVVKKKGLCIWCMR